MPIFEICRDEKIFNKCHYYFNNLKLKFDDNTLFILCSISLIKTINNKNYPSNPSLVIILSNIDLDL